VPPARAISRLGWGRVGFLGNVKLASHLESVDQTAMPNSAPKPLTEDEIRKATIGEPRRLDGPVLLAEYDPSWPEQFAREARRITSALGQRAVQVEHIGSTSVPGLVAKPIIDILLVVADSADEAAYVPALEAAGYVLRIREPDWHQHRLFKGPDTNVNIHVFSSGSAEVERNLAFRDRLRANATDREIYARTKRELAAKDWKFVQNYADAKSEVVEAILARARPLPPTAGESRAPHESSSKAKPSRKKRSTADGGR
jgi:GrpB-like predicted nucleotidyltransferase (UPF0157 family)